jgi:hypothetical protein
VCRAAIILMVLMLSAAAARAAIDEAALLRDLQSPDYAVRDAASQRMLEDESLGQADFRRLYAAAVTPEQRQRLLDAARHHFLRAAQEDATKLGGASSMGLTLLPLVPAGEIAGIDQPAARVGATYPGFPAYAQLKPGDLILTIDGREVPDAEAGGIPAFIERIKAHPLDRPLNITGLRGGEPFAVTMKPASRTALQTIYSADGAELRAELEEGWMKERRELEKLAPAAPALRVVLPPLD